MIFGLFLALASGSALAAGQFRAELTGASEVPANASTATGTAHLKLNKDGTTLRVQVRYEGLGTGVTGAHIHTGAAGINGPVLVDLEPTLGQTSGSIDNLVATLTPEAASALAAGNLYINVHTTQFPGGEIRGQLLAHPDKEATDTDAGKKGDGEADSEY